MFSTIRNTSKKKKNTPTGVGFSSFIRGLMSILLTSTTWSAVHGVSRPRPIRRKYAGCTGENTVKQVCIFFFVDDVVAPSTLFYVRSVLL